MKAIGRGLAGITRASYLVSVVIDN
uniref:Uncharacterized protein n=1 Tax=Romanomermis culicivorax TaxID=13658 RepID=A0A915J7H3_ROMCU